MPPEVSGVAAEPPVASPEDNGDVDFDATLAFDPVENLGRAQHAGVGTELFAPPMETNGDGVSVPEIADEIEDRHDSFVTVIAGSQAGAIEVPVYDDPLPPPAMAPVAAPSGKKGSRAFAIFGIFAAVLVLAAGAATGGWYLYRNYYASAVVTEPSPSPEPTVAETPLSVTTETLVDSNAATRTNTNSTLVESVVTNTNQSELPSQTQPRSEIETNTSRPNPPGTRPSNRPATTTANKPAPKPKTNPGRTDILQ